MSQPSANDRGAAQPGRAPADDEPIAYRQRISSYYQALGYGAPYEWAHYTEVPFTPLSKPLSGARIALVTTAAPYRPDAGDQGPGAPYNAAAKFYRVYSATAPATPTCASPMWRSTASTPRPLTSAVIFRSPRCAGRRRPGASAA